VPEAVGIEVRAVAVSQVGESRRSFDAEGGARAWAQLRADEHGSVIGEADKARVEGRVPQSGEEEAVVHVEPLCIVALGPWHDVGGAQQGWFSDAGLKQRFGESRVDLMAYGRTPWS
jgi:hypothetical protein